jgi:hypothetical protein
MHRWVWDLHETTPDAPRYEYPISAVLRNTPREPRGPWALPGRYRVRLTLTDASGQSRGLGQTLDVRMDPRVTTPSAALARQHALARRLADGMNRSAAALREVRAGLAELKLAFPSPVPPRSPVKDYVAVLGDVSRIELAAGKLM